MEFCTVKQWFKYGGKTAESILLERLWMTSTGSTDNCFGRVHLENKQLILYNIAPCWDDDDVYVLDEDGDLVAFSSNDELMMGLACMKDSTFRVFIKGTNRITCMWRESHLTTDWMLIVSAKRCLCLWQDFIKLFQRRRSTAETFPFMPSLHSPLATLLLLLLLELLMPLPLTWPQPCTPTSLVTAVRALWWELASSVQFVLTTTCALPARLEGRTLSTLCCLSGTHYRWGTSWEEPCLYKCVLYLHIYTCSVCVYM